MPIPLKVISNIDSNNPLRGAVEIIPDRLYYCALTSTGKITKKRILIRNPHQNNNSSSSDRTSATSSNTTAAITAAKIPVTCFTIDEELVYWNFFLDYGPLNLGQLYRFTVKLNRLLSLQQAEVEKEKRNNNDGGDGAILFYSSTDPDKRANAIYLICAWQILQLQRTPEEAFYGFSKQLHQQQQQQLNEHNSNDDDDDHDRMELCSTDHTNANTNTNCCSRPPLYPLSRIGQQTTKDLPSWHDASPHLCRYQLTVLDCLRSLQLAKRYNFFDWEFGNNSTTTLVSSNNSNNNNSNTNTNDWYLHHLTNQSNTNNHNSDNRNKFNIIEYEYFEQVENGDLNWIIKDRVLAFAGPSYRKNVSPEGYCTLSPTDYVPYFRRKNVGLVVRLNKKNYDETEFINAGINHFEQFYTDGSCPTMTILRRIVQSFETLVPNNCTAFAVHCKAGLGRTGTCIGAWMMKHYRMTAKDVIGWMRICRPGMVIGPQQQFLADIEHIMWQDGATMRSLHSSNRVMNTAIVDTNNINNNNQSRNKSRSSGSMNINTAMRTSTVVPVVTPSRGRNTTSATRSLKHPFYDSTKASTSITAAVTVVSSCNGKEDGHEVMLLGDHGSSVVGTSDPGQASRLLEARMRHNNRNSFHQSSSSLQASLSPPGANQKQQTVLITPNIKTNNDDNDNGNNNQSTNKSPPGAKGTASSSSLWARAFA